ncbi:MAG TPA: hypothetical protein VF432_17940 [Thermoanaerobaculia bacterium]
MRSKTQESFAGKVQRAIRIYGTVRPKLTALASFPVIPAPWRRGITQFLDALDAVAADPSAGNVAARFKAGKDI